MKNQDYRIKSAHLAWYVRAGSKEEAHRLFVTRASSILRDMSTNIFSQNYPEARKEIVKVLKGRFEVLTEDEWLKANPD